MKLIIISSHSTKLLQDEAEKYNIEQLGSLTVNNGHYFLTFLGEPKVVESSAQLELPLEPTPKTVSAKKFQKKP
jgi:hypothetical protein